MPKNGEHSQGQSGPVHCKAHLKLFQRSSEVVLIRAGFSCTHYGEATRHVRKNLLVGAFARLMTVFRPRLRVDCRWRFLLMLMTSAGRKHQHPTSSEAPITKLQ